MRILVTGAAGFVARHLVPTLESAGHEVFTTDVIPAAVGMPRYTVCDLCKPGDVKALVSGIRPDACMHLAGITFVPDAARDPGRLYAINVGGTQNVLESLRQAVPGARFLFVSTAQVYGCTFDPSSAALTEDAPVYPLSPYAISKVAGEAVTRAYGEYHGLQVFIARPSNHTGPGQAVKFIVPSFIEQAKRIRRGEADCFVAGNLSSGRDFSDVRDVVSAYLKILERGVPGATYNVSASPRATIAELFAAIKRLAGVDAPIREDPALVRPTDFSRVLNTSRLCALGWAPRYALSDTLRDMLSGKVDDEG